MSRGSNRRATGADTSSLGSGCGGIGSRIGAGGSGGRVAVAGGGGGAGGVGRATGGWLFWHAAAPISSTRQMQSNDLSLINVVVTMSIMSMWARISRAVQFDQFGNVLLPVRVICRRPLPSRAIVKICVLPSRDEDERDVPAVGRERRAFVGAGAVGDRLASGPSRHRRF